MYWNIVEYIRGHSLSTDAKFSKKLTFLTPWYAHVGTYVLNGWPLKDVLE